MDLFGPIGGRGLSVLGGRGLLPHSRNLPPLPFPGLVSAVDSILPVDSPGLTVSQLNMYLFHLCVL